MRDFADCLAANKRNKGESMHYLRVNHGLLFRSGLVLLFVLWANGCGHEAKEEKEESAGEYVKISCADRTVDVDPTVGAKPVAVYVCSGRTVTWKANGHVFKVEFKGDSPFSGDEKAFHNDHATSKSMKHLSALTVFEYKITVDGRVFDPQVIGGGGN
jgi:hypothetical protein